MRLLPLLACLFVVCDCREERPAAPTKQESAQLNDAEAMLNGMSRNEEEPEDRSPGPSNR